jgi:hypothetical protein
MVPLIMGFPSWTKTRNCCWIWKLLTSLVFTSWIYLSHHCRWHIRLVINLIHICRRNCYRCRISPSFRYHWIHSCSSRNYFIWIRSITRWKRFRSCYILWNSCWSLHLRHSCYIRISLRTISRCHSLDRRHIQHRYSNWRFILLHSHHCCHIRQHLVPSCWFICLDRRNHCWNRSLRSNIIHICFSCYLHLNIQPNTRHRSHWNLNRWNFRPNNRFPPIRISHRLLSNSWIRSKPWHIRYIHCIIQNWSRDRCLCWWNWLCLIPISIRSPKLQRWSLS